MLRNRRFHYRDCDSEKICYLCDAFLRFGWTCEFSGSVLLPRGKAFLFATAGKAAANNVGQHALFQFERAVRDLPIFVHQSGRITYVDNLRILSKHRVW